MFVADVDATSSPTNAPTSVRRRGNEHTPTPAPISGEPIISALVSNEQDLMLVSDASGAPSVVPTKAPTPAEAIKLAISKITSADSGEIKFGSSGPLLVAAPTPVPEADDKISKGWLIGLIVAAILFVLLVFLAMLIAFRKTPKSQGFVADIVLHFEVRGHVNMNALASDDEAKELSLNRAKRVHDALIQAGVKPEILSAPIGCGSDQPLVSDGWDDDAYKNLRVEIQLINIEDLASTLGVIYLEHPDWNPKQDFHICGSPDVTMDVENGILHHKDIHFKTHSAEFADAEHLASVQALARALVFLETQAEKARNEPVVLIDANAAPVRLNASQKALQAHIGDGQQHHIKYKIAPEIELDLNQIKITQAAVQGLVEEQKGAFDSESVFEDESEIFCIV